MRVRQYVHFDLRSLSVTAAEMTARLGIEPDEARLRGSRRLEPTVVPWAHIWKVECRQPGFRVDEQLAVLLDRLEPHVDAIATLAAALRTADGLEPGSRDSAQLSVARWFDVGDGEEEDDGLVTLDDGRVLERAGGQHQLLGWWLDRRTLEFLDAVRAELNVDEYG